MDPEGPSVYRPEAGSYISNIAAANSLFSHRLHDRLGEPQYIDSLHSQGSASSMWMRHVGGHERSRAGDGQLNTQANFLATAKVLRFPEVQMHEILSDFARMIPAALDNVKTSLPTDFPENVVTAVETNVLRLHGRLSREYGSK